MKMRVLVTGGTGFIGQHVVGLLNVHNHLPVLFDRETNYEGEIGYRSLGDVRDAVAVNEAMSRCDAFIHLAAVLGTQETISNPAPAVETNLIGSVNVLQAAAEHKVPGSYIAVGNHWMNNPYSITKSTVERFVDMYNRFRGTKINIVRAMNAYGPGQEPVPPWGHSRVRKITPSFMCRAWMNEDIEIYGDGEQVSDMVYVGDVAYALVRAMEVAANGTVIQNPIEVGPSESNTVNEVAQLIKEVTHSASKIVHLPMRPGEDPNAIVKADNTSLLSIGMRPNELTTLRSGMAVTARYFRDRLIEGGHL